MVAAAAPESVERLVSGFQSEKNSGGRREQKESRARCKEENIIVLYCCKKGISHHPAESMTLGDADTASRVLLNFLRNFES